MALNIWLQEPVSVLNNSRHAPPDGSGPPHHAQRYRTRRRNSRRAARQRLNLEVLEGRCVPALYAVTDLGTLGGPHTYAYDLNQAGQVVGDSTIAAGGFMHAFLWDSGTMIDLGTLGGSHSSATGINDLGQVVGYASLPGDVSNHAFLVTPEGGVWFRDNNQDGRNDLMTDLGTLYGSDSSGASDINNSGQVVGTSADRAFLWDAVNGMTDLGAPTGFTDSSAAGINALGRVTGYAWYYEDESSWGSSVFLWDATNGMIALGTGPAYTNSTPTALNDVGQLVGYQSNPDLLTDYAFLWTPNSPNAPAGSFTDLGTLPGGFESYANGINNGGQVVGWSTVLGVDYFYEYHPFLWDASGGTVNLLGQIVPGSDAMPQFATAINDAGSILVDGHNAAQDRRAYLLTPVRSISITNATPVTEGQSGTTEATFTVTLSEPSDQTVTVDFVTANGSAAAGSDYQTASGTLTFTPGETSQTVTVQVNGDRRGETNETFFVTLSNATNAPIDDGQGVGTIVDDEPRISVSDVTMAEGPRNQTTLFTFTVTLSAPYDQPVTVSYRTVNGTAKSGEDYIAQSGTLTFAPGETTKTISIAVKGDSKRESNETFYLDLFGLSTNALFTKNRGIGTILNDD